MLGISRWTGKGGSYRTIQRFFRQTFSWCCLNWYLMRYYLQDEDDVILIAGDTTTVTKSGKQTYGLGRYFSSIYNRMIPGLSFFTLSLISVKQRQSFPIMIEQVTQEEEEQTPTKQDSEGCAITSFIVDTGVAASFTAAYRQLSLSRCTLFMTAL